MPFILRGPFLLVPRHWDLHGSYIILKLRFKSNNSHSVTDQKINNINNFTQTWLIDKGLSATFTRFLGDSKNCVNNYEKIVSINP
jgi:hypothetical protein